MNLLLSGETENIDNGKDIPSFRFAFDMVIVWGVEDKRDTE